MIPIGELQPGNYNLIIPFYQQNTSDLKINLADPTDWVYMQGDEEDSSKTIILTMILSTILGKTRNRHTIYHSQSIYLKCRWMEPGHQFVWLSQPEVFFMLKRKRAKAIRSPASTRPSVKHATAGERRIRGVRLYTMWSTGFRTKVAQQKRAI